MKILITGVTGFVGGYLLRMFGAMKRELPSLELVATARRAEAPPEIAEWTNVYFPADLSEGCAPVTVSVCIHAAGLADDRSTALEFYRANVVATRNLLDKLQGCRLFIYISSASVYGFSRKPLRESDATAESGLSDYGRSKWEAEQTVREICDQRGINYVILRPRAIYGTGDRVLLPRLLRLMRPPLLLIIGKGEASISLTSICHLGAVIRSVVFRDTGFKSGVFNVADAEVYRLESVLRALYVGIHKRLPRVVCIPVWFVQAYIRILEAMRRRGALSRQSLGYLTESCVLDCTTTRDQFDFIPSETFFDQVGAIGQTVARGKP